jgi:hypothetical protein
MPNNEPSVDTDRVLHYRQRILPIKQIREEETGKRREMKVFLNTLSFLFGPSVSIQSNDTDTRTYEQHFMTSFIEIFGILNFSFDNVVLFPFFEFMIQSKTQNATSKFYFLPVSPAA